MNDNVLKLIQLDKLQKNLEIKKGTVLLSSDYGEKVLFILHSGSVGIYHSSHDSIDMQSVRIDLIDKSQYFGFENYLPKDRYIPTFICESDSVISIYPFSNIERLAFNSSKSFTYILRIMFHRFFIFVRYNNRLASMASSLFTYNNKFIELLKNLGIVVSNLKFISYNRDLSEKVSLSSPDLFIKTSFEQNYYRFFQLRDFSVIKQLLSSDHSVDFEVFVKKNTSLAVSIFNVILSEYNAIYEHIFYNIDNIHREMSCLVVDSDSILEEIKFNNFKFSGKEAQVFFSQVYSFLAKNYFDHPLFSTLYDRKQIDQRLNLDIQADEEDDHIGVVEEISDNPSEDFGGNDLEVSDDYKSFLLGNVSDVSDVDLYKYIKKVNKFFLELWINTFFSVEEKKEKNKQKILLLDKGVVHIDTIGKKEYIKLMEHRDRTTGGDYEIYSLYEWMNVLLEEKDVPSNNDMGISFRKYMMHEMRMWSKKLKDAYEKKTPVELKRDKVNFELKNMVSMTFRVLNESPLRAIFPICSSTYASVETGKFIFKKDIQELVDEICDCDFSLFYREILFRVSETKNTILQKEVKPLFIIFPCVGHRVVFWQEMVENKKTSRARFMVPLIFVGNLKKAMLPALGAMRWELCKSIKGSSWSDPIHGGLTGVYMDYISFYSKNSQLSMEAKKKLANLLRNSRNDYKVVFMKQYIDWIECEKEGLVRLNTLEREIFMRFLPFKKDICANLESIPTYDRIIKRYKNLKNKAMLTAKNSFKKLIKKDGTYPQEVQDYIDFLGL